MLAAAADITMMSLLVGMEGTEGQWRDLVERAGSKVVEVRRSPDWRDVEGVVECELP